jgi:hypothetical protein
MFPTFGLGKRKGQAVPRWGKNFLKWRIRPISQMLGIPDRLVTFQMMRRTLGTMERSRTRKRYASIRTTGDIYVEVVEESVMRAVNSHATAVLDGWTPAVEGSGPKGCNIRSVPTGTKTRQGSIAI